jgi:tetratricopeptide (TPR) repeat protein
MDAVSVADLITLSSLCANGVLGFDAFVASVDAPTLALLRAAALFGGDVPKRGAFEVAKGIAGEEVRDVALASLFAARILVDVDGSAARREPWMRLGPPSLAERVLADLDDTARRDYLTAAAQWLSRQCLDDSAMNQARVAALAHEAGLDGSAAHALTEAARIELESGRLSTAAPYLERAIALATGEAADAIDHARAHASLAEAALDAGRPAEAEAHVAAGLACVDPGRPLLVAKLLNRRADAAVHAGELESAVAHLDEALEILGEDGDPMELAETHALMGWVLGYRMGRNEEGIVHGMRALEVAARIQAPAFRASLCGRLGANYLRAGNWDGQLETNRRDLELSTLARDSAGIVRANINLGVCFHNRGYLDLAKEHTERAKDLAARTGAAGAAQIADNNLAMIALDDDRDDDVERHAAAVVECAARTGFRRALPETLITLARLAVRRADVDAAEAHLAAAESGGDVADLEMASRARALLDLVRGDVSMASERMSTVMATHEHDPYERAESRITWAAVLRARGEESAASEAEAAADRVFERLGADAALERRRWCR